MEFSVESVRRFFGEMTGTVRHLRSIETSEIAVLGSECTAYLVEVVPVPFGTTAEQEEV